MLPKDVAAAFHAAGGLGSLRVRRRPAAGRAHEPPSPHGIFLVCAGREAEELGDTTLPFVHAYGDRFGLDTYLIDGDWRVRYPSPHFLKLDAIRYGAAAGLVRFLLLDLDILISPGAPDIFARHPHGSWGVNEFPPPKSAGPGKQFLVDEVQAMFGKVPWPPGVYHNSGVLLFDRRDAQVLMDAFAPPYRDHHVAADASLREQSQLNWFLHAAGLRLQDLDRSWNYCAISVPDWTPRYLSATARRRQYFIHYAGPVAGFFVEGEVKSGRDRIQHIRADIAAWEWAAG